MCYIMNHDKELSNLDLDYLYSKSNLKDIYRPSKVNIVTTYKKDALPGQKSLESPLDLFKTFGHVVIFHRWKTGGAHWLTLLRDKQNNVIIFDSLGKNGMQKDKKEFDLLIKRLKENGFKNIIVNTKQYQSNNSNCCGKYAIFAIAMNKLFNGVNIKQLNNYLNSKKITNFDDYILKLFSNDI